MIADVLRASFDPTISGTPDRRRQLFSTADALALMFKMDNPEFDYDRFMAVVMNTRREPF